MNGLMLFLPPARRIALHHSEKHCVFLLILNNSTIFSHLASLFEAVIMDSCCFQGLLWKGRASSRDVWYSAWPWSMPAAFIYGEQTKCCCLMHRLALFKDSWWKAWFHIGDKLKTFHSLLWRWLICLLRKVKEKKSHAIGYLYSISFCFVNL